MFSFLQDIEHPKLSQTLQAIDWTTSPCRLSLVLATFEFQCGYCRGDHLENRLLLHVVFRHFGRSVVDCGEIGCGDEADSDHLEIQAQQISTSAQHRPNCLYLINILGRGDLKVGSISNPLRGEIVDRSVDELNF